MALRQLRRLAPPARVSLYDEMAAQALHALYFRRDIERVEREHPELIVRDGANVLLAQPAGAAKLAYSYESDRAFTELFPPMLDVLLPRARRALRADTVRFRLSHSPSRPLVEPVLKRLLFQPKRDWMEFEITRGAASRPPALSGVRFRDASADDAEAVARIDREAFPDTPMPLSAYRALIESGEEPALLALRRGEAVGLCSYAQHDPGAGYIHTLAVAEAARREGIGQALTARVLKRLFSDGAERVALTTDGDNTPAIRLYLKLGFRQTRAGRDYERPADPKAVERLLKRSQGTLIKFGGWR